MGDEMMRSTLFTALVLVRAALANTPPANVAFSHTATIPHDHDPTTSAVTVELNPVATDADGDHINYLWRCPPDAHPVHVASLTAVFTGAGTRLCKLTASDGYGAATTGVVTVQINAEPNAKPQAHAGKDTSWTIPHDESPLTNTAAVVLDGKESTDSDGDPLLWAWNCSAGASNGQHWNHRWPALATGEVATVELPQGTHQCQLVVTDTYGATSSDLVQVVVAAEPNAAPVANAGPDATYTVPHDFYPTAETNTVRVVLDGTATADADGDRLTHHWDCGENIGTQGTRHATVKLPFPVIMNSQGPDKTHPAKLGKWPGDGDDTTFLVRGTGAGEGGEFSGVWTHQPNKVIVHLQAGTHTCSLTTKDTYGATSTDSVVITVNAEPNTDPNAAG